jgi:hypothetical protein
LIFSKRASSNLKFHRLKRKALVIFFLIAGAAPLLAAWASGIEPESHWSELGAGLAMISGAVFFSSSGARLGRQQR